MVIDSFPKFEAELNNMVVKANLAMLHAFCNTNDKKYKKCKNKMFCLSMTSN